MKSKSSLPVSLQPMPLAAYLTGAVGSTFLISAPQAEAAVTSVTFGFGSVLNSSYGYSQFQTTPNLGTLPGYADRGFVILGIGMSPLGVYNQGVNGPYGAAGAAKFLANDTVVGNGNNGGFGGAFFSQPGTGSPYDIPTDQLNKNIGFRTSTGNWGWANVSWDATNKALTFNSAYVESVPGNTITVGDTGISAVPEPSRALLALAGLGGVALRRRRKQAA